METPALIPRPERTLTGKPHKCLANVERIACGRAIANICSSVWEMECTKENKGVRPLVPPVRRDDFAQAASRTPTLGWKASGDPDLSYDIAIFEARAIDQQGYKTQYIKGPVIEYAEGIKTARFKLKNELKAKTKYYLSVRLRKG